MKHGKGVLNFYNGDVFEGEFKNDEMYFGVYNYKKGDVYTGDLRGGKPNGKGIYTFVSGNRLQGLWTDGALTEEREVDIHLR